MSSVPTKYLKCQQNIERNTSFRMWKCEKFLSSLAYIYIHRFSHWLCFVGILVINLNQFLYASLSTLTWHIGGAKFTNLSLSCAQSCVTTYWYHVWYLLSWLMIIYAWLSTTHKQVGKILILPKSTHFIALCSVKREEIYLSCELC